MKKLLIMVGVLSLMLPCVATAGAVGAFPDPADVDFYASSHAGAPDSWQSISKYPTWSADWFQDYNWIKLQNTEDPRKFKFAWLRITLDTPDGLVANSLPKPPEVSFKGVYRDGTDQVGQGGVVEITPDTVTWRWWVFPQPGEDNWIFPAVNSQGLPYNVFRDAGALRVEIATVCIPLPASVWSGMGLMAGLFGVAGWRRRA